MSDFFISASSIQAVMLVFKTVIYKSKLLDFKDIASLNLEHSESNTDFMDRLYLKANLIVLESREILHCSVK